MEKAVKLKQYSWKETYGPQNNWRPGTQIRPGPVKFIFNAGGMGDFINYSAAILWIASHCPWIHGTVYVSDFFVPFLRHILKDFPKWLVAGGNQIQLNDVCYIGPELVVNGHNISKQLCNATGSHLMDLGFQYFANMQAAPADWTLPYLEFGTEDLAEGLVPQKYVVFTPGAVLPVRATSGVHLNPLIAYVLRKGFTPVFLGKRHVTETLGATFADDIDYHRGIDLREQTTVLEAAAVMQHSACVLGLDNGLLHLAACTEANLIFGYNITNVKDRAPRRYRGKTIHVTVPKEELACIGCQSNGKLMLNHNYQNCYYGDQKCIGLLFSGGRFERALDEILGGTDV